MKILMVCLGNICRSPLAQGILEAKANEYGWDVEVDSAGTNGYHDGELPDARSIKVALEHGIDLSHQRSRRITATDLAYYDLIYTMDSSNYNNVLAMANNSKQIAKVKMIMNELHPKQNIDVPDPYYGGDNGFENVYQMLALACEAITIKHQ